MFALMMVLTVLSGTPQQGLVSRLCLCSFIPLTKADSCQIWWGQSRWKSKPGVKSLLCSRTWSPVRLQVHSACVNASRFCLSWFLMAICLCYTSSSSSLLMELSEDKQLQPSPGSVWAQDGLGLMFTFSVLASFILLSVCFCSFLLLFKPSWGPTEPTLVCIVSRTGILPCTAEVLGQVSAEQSGWSGSECFWPSSSPPRCRTAHPPPLPAVRSRHTSSAAYTNTSNIHWSLPSHQAALLSNLCSAGCFNLNQKFIVLMWPFQPSLLSWSSCTQKLALHSTLV